MAQILNIYYPIEFIEGSSGNTSQEERESAIVEFDEVLASANDAITQGNFFVGMPHRIMSWLAIEDGSLSAEPYDDYGLAWKIDATYSIKGATANKSDPNNAVYRPEVVPFNWTYEKVVTQDKENGNAIENAAGDPLDPPFMEIIPNIGWRITLREGSANMNRCFQIGNINQAEFTMLGLQIPKYCAQLSNYTPSPQYDQLGNFYSLNTYEIKWNFARSKETNEILGFKQEVINMGLNFLKTPNDVTTNTRIYNLRTLEPVQNHVKLNADGTIKNTKDTADYLQFVINDLADFSAFGLPLIYPSFQV